MEVGKEESVSFQGKEEKKKSERLDRRIFLEYTEKQALGQDIRQDFGQ